MLITGLLKSKGPFVQSASRRHAEAGLQGGVVFGSWGEGGRPKRCSLWMELTKPGHLVFTTPPSQKRWESVP